MSNLIERIGACRDSLISGDYKQILKNIYLFTLVWQDVKKHIDKYIKNPNHELDFNIYDLQELSDEIENVLNDISPQLRYINYYNGVNKLENITNETLKEITHNICDLMYIDTKLRECYKIISYNCLILKLWNLQNERQDLDYVVLETIRSFLRK